MKYNFENNRYTGENLFLKQVSSDNLEDFDLDNSKNIIDDYIYQKIATFPKTRYYGSKKRILKWIYDNLKDLKFDTVLDGFGGTASVSLLFKAMNKEVTYNDILKSNYISANTLLQNKMPVKILEAEKFIDSIKPIKNSFISQNFQNIFYTDYL